MNHAIGAGPSLEADERRLHRRHLLEAGVVPDPLVLVHHELVALVVQACHRHDLVGELAGVPGFARPDVAVVGDELHVLAADVLELGGLLRGRAHGELGRVAVVGDPGREVHSHAHRYVHHVLDAGGNVGVALAAHDGAGGVLDRR